MEMLSTFDISNIIFSLFTLESLQFFSSVVFGFRGPAFFVERNHLQNITVLSFYLFRHNTQDSELFSMRVLPLLQNTYKVTYMELTVVSVGTKYRFWGFWIDLTHYCTWKDLWEDYAIGGQITKNYMPNSPTPKNYWGRD